MAPYKAKFGDESKDDSTRDQYNGSTETVKTSTDKAAGVTTPKLGIEVAGIYISMGLDSDKYPGKIVLFKQKEAIARFTYLEWQKVDAFFTQHADIFNQQFDKESAAMAALLGKRR